MQTAPARLSLPPVPPRLSAADPGRPVPAAAPAAGTVMYRRSSVAQAQQQSRAEPSAQPPVQAGVAPTASQQTVADQCGMDQAPPLTGPAEPAARSRTGSMASATPGVGPLQPQGAAPDDVQLGGGTCCCCSRCSCCIRNALWAAVSVNDMRFPLLPIPDSAQHLVLSAAFMLTRYMQEALGPCPSSLVSPGQRLPHPAAAQRASGPLQTPDRQQQLPPAWQRGSQRPLLALWLPSRASSTAWTCSHASWRPGRRCAAGLTPLQRQGSKMP